MSVVYHKKTSTTVTRDGLAEQRSREIDVIGGTDTIGLRRQIVDRGVEIKRTRQLCPGAASPSAESTTRTGYNVREEDEEAFEREWESRMMARTGQINNYGGYGSSSAGPAALYVPPRV
eukprot:PhM_4_TR14240/c2_g1_i3/m.66885